MKIAILGYGKMGHEVEKAALARRHDVAVTIDNEHEWDEKSALLDNADIAIDFSQPEQAVPNILRCFERHLPIVVGTTAWYDQLETLKTRCQYEEQSLFYAPNFSIGMNMMFKINKQMARFAEKYGYQLSLAETHHVHKLDKPSGTALKLAKDIIMENSQYRQWSIDIPNASDTLYIDVTREGEVNGIHSVKARSTVDQITFCHEAFSRQGFALGAIAAAEFLIGKKGCYTMDDLLEI